MLHRSSLSSLSLFTSLLIAGALGCGGDGVDGQDGMDGAGSLLSVEAEAAGENCANGGSRIDHGVDANGDGVLDEDEIGGTSYLCNGADGEDGDDGIDGTDGAASLVIAADEPAGANCPAGGKVLSWGRDLDGDGELADTEVEDSAYVCDGVAGEAATESLLEVTLVPDGATCRGGGFRVETGVDDDGDDVLSTEEIDDTDVFCPGGYLGGAVACYSFEGDTLDATANTADAWAVGGTSFTTGAIGQGIKLDGVDGHVELPSLTGLSDVTVAGWLQLDAAPGIWTRFFDGGRYENTLFITVNNGQDDITARLWDAGSMGEAGPGASTPAIGEWHHLAMTYEQGGQGLRFYFDGVLVGENAVNGGGYDTWGGNQNFYIGRSNWCDCEPYLPGVVDEFVVYDRALTATEIDALYGGGADGAALGCADLTD